MNRRPRPDGDRDRDRLDAAFAALASPPGPEGGRGAADVLSGARTVARRRRQQRRAGLAALGAAAVAVVVLGFGSLSGGDDGDVETEGSPATDPSPTVTSAPPESTTTVPGDGTTTTTTNSTSTAAPTTTVAPPGQGGPPGGTPGGRPGPDSTGPDGTPLTPMGTDEVEALMRPGAVIEDVLITGGNLDVVADDVILRNFRLEGGGAPYGIRSTDGHTGFVAEDGEILDVSSAGFYGSGATLRRLDVHDSDNAAFKLVTGVTVEASWWHHLGRGGGSGLGAQFEVGSGGTNALLGNLCDIPVGQAGYDGDACVQVNGDAPWTLTIEGNWFDGGDNTVDCGGSPGTTLRSNRFGRRLAGQPIVRCPTATANVWDDTGAPIG